MAFDKYYMDRSGKPYQGIYEESVAQKFMLGERYAEPGPLGRVFRYALNGGVAITAGKLLSGAAFMGAATAVEVTDAIAITAPVGASVVYVTFTNAQAADIFAGGLLVISDGTAATRFESYVIKSHPAGTASVPITLYDSIITSAIAASELAYVAANPWRQTVLCATGQLNMPVGVALTNINIGYWFWCQTWGPVGMYNEDGPLVAGTNLMNSAATAGSAYSDTGAIVESCVGATQMVGTDAHCAINFLRIAP